MGANSSLKKKWSSSIVSVHCPFKLYPVPKIFHFSEFLDSEPLNNMLDDMIANAVDNFDNPRKHVTYDNDRIGLQ